MKNTFHITITEPATGEILIDQDTNCIIGACDSGDKGTHLMTFTNCDTLDKMTTATGALEMVEKALRREPKTIQLLVRKTAKANAKKAN